MSKKEELNPASRQTDSTPIQSKSTSISTFTLILLFIAWYGFNGGYNVFNSYVKADVPWPIFVSVIQLAVGLIYALPLWVLGLRDAPVLTLSDIGRLLPIVALNALGHYAAVAAMFEKGGGSFTHVIKASEPVVSAILAVVINGVIPKPLTALSLVPISYGFAYPSTLGNLSIASMSKELTTTAAKLAMTSNVSFSLRSIVKKSLSSEFKTRTKLTSANEHAVTTILSTVVLMPFMFYYENVSDIVTSIQVLPQPQQQTCLFYMILSGFSFYLYNEMQNIVLGSLGAVPTAVGNTLKRVVIFVALFYCTVGEVFPWPKIFGCAIAILGCLLFALFDSWKL